MNEMHKYPRTQHIEGSGIQKGDEDLDTVPLREFAGRHLVVEEKMDGANSAMSFRADGRLQLQSRGHYLSGGEREKVPPAQNLGSSLCAGIMGSAGRSLYHVRRVALRQAHGFLYRSAALFHGVRHPRQKQRRISQHRTTTGLPVFPALCGLRQSALPRSGEQHASAEKPGRTIALYPAGSEAAPGATLRRTRPG